MNEAEKFKLEVTEQIRVIGADPVIQKLGLSLTQELCVKKYPYSFTWMGRPIIQFPQDIVAMQEIIHEVKPDLIIETGIAHGGSLIAYASFLELLGGNGSVLGIDIDIRSNNRKEIEAHPMFKRIQLLEGSSISAEIIEKVKIAATGKKNILVVLDSMHSHEHVLQELKLYSPLVSVNSYIVVFDTVVEDMPVGSYPDRPWDKGNNPKTAVWEFLKSNQNFKINEEIDSKLVLSCAHNGFLKRTR